VNAELGAEGVASARNLERTPAAETATIRASRNRFAVDPTALHGPRGAHRFLSNAKESVLGGTGAIEYKD